MGEALALLKQLGVNWTFFLMMGLFILTFLICSGIALNPLRNILVERDKRMEGREKEVAKIQAELAEVKADLEKQRNAAQKLASQKFADLKAEAVEEQRKILNEAREKSAAELKALKAKLEQNFLAEKAKLDQEIVVLEKVLFQGVIGERA